MLVNPLSISSFGTLFLVSSNTALPVIFLIAIILVVLKHNFVVQDCSECRGGGGGGGRKWVHRNLYLQLLSPSSNSLAAIGFCAPLFLRSTNFILPLELLIGFISCQLGGQC